MSLQEFYSKYRNRAEDYEKTEEKKLEEGRLYIRNQMCTALMLAVSWPAYDFDAEVALVDWKYQQWTRLLQILEEIHEISEDTSKSYPQLVVACKLHRSLAFLRGQLERRVDERNRGKVNVGERTMRKLL